MAVSICISLIASFIWLNSKGVNGAGSTPTLFFSAGGRAVLNCTNVLYKNCSSTTWNYSNATTPRAIEEVARGQVNQNSESNRAERLAVDSACALVINDVTAEDAGRYTCQQFNGGTKHGDNAPVNLVVLQVSASPSVSHIEPGGKVSLQCNLHSHDGCGGTVQGKGTHLSWVDSKGQELLSSGNRKTIKSQCTIIITEQLTDLNPSEKQRTWTCQLTAEGRDQVSSSITIPVKGPPNHMVPVIVAALVSCCLLATVVIVIIYRRRTNSKKNTQGTSDQNRVISTASQSQETPDNVGETEELHYASLDHLKEPQTKISERQGDVNATYSTVMPPAGDKRHSTRPADPNALYATVQKTDRT